MARLPHRNLIVGLVVVVFVSTQLYLHTRYHSVISSAGGSGGLTARAVQQGGRTGRVTLQQDAGAHSSGQQAAAGDPPTLPKPRPQSELPFLADGSVFGPGNEDTGCVARNDDVAGVVAAVVVVTCCRANYLERTMNALLDVHGQDASNGFKFPLFVSQDGANAEVAESLKSYMPPIKVLQHVELREPVRQINAKENLAYYRIANHYKFIFNQFFDCFGYPALVILEDDMEVAPDFFAFFEAGARLLAADPGLYAVSSWNDHGQEAFVRDAYRLRRSDFFPGLGWMMPARLWAELRPQWPHAYWDDWMRLASVRKGRQSVYPEVCRNYNFGEHGSSKGQFFKQYLKPIKLNTVAVPWLTVDLGYLDAARYERDFNASLAAAHVVATPTDVRGASGDVKLLYKSERHYKMLARGFKMMPDWRDGVPRGSYRGTVVIHVGDARVFLARADDFDPTPDLDPPPRRRPGRPPDGGVAAQHA